MSRGNPDISVYKTQIRGNPGSNPGQIIQCTFCRAGALFLRTRVCVDVTHEKRARGRARERHTCAPRTRAYILES